MERAANTLFIIYQTGESYFLHVRHSLVFSSSHICAPQPLSFSMSLMQTLTPVDTLRSSNEISEKFSLRTFTDTSTLWGPGTLSGRAILALGEVTIRGIDAILIRWKIAAIRQRSSGTLSSSMYKDLVELCRPALYSVRIAKEAIRLALAQICIGSDISRYRIVAFFTSEIEHHSGRGLERFHDFLTAIIQVKDGWKSVVVEAGLLLNTTFPPLVNHPLQILSDEMAIGLPGSPLASLQDAYSADMRSKTWMFPQAYGLVLVRNRIVKIERILQDTDGSSTAETSEFDSTIQSSALACLRTITESQWRTVYEFFQLPIGDLTTGSALASEGSTISNFDQKSYHYQWTWYIGRGVYLSRDIATAVTRLGHLKITHPIITICSDILAWRKISPLSKLQESGTDSDSRFNTWKATRKMYGDVASLDTCFSLHLRLSTARCKHIGVLAPSTGPYLLFAALLRHSHTSCGYGRARRSCRMLSEMCSEEKEREMEKLFVLFDRLERDGVRKAIEKAATAPVDPDDE
ncbi:hypothetical protein B0H17DRAFT_1269450 [Mycena rosella]|uniref:Uncharacterized protein n=1 Tax=Mycena rosella TaxID=1033263 RepID=A0AAD7DNY2_MYCRO|nr:hypothetical protein B0H17DRAFT_1269450 [Mycena rosella]